MSVNIATRIDQNPIIDTADIRPSRDGWVVEGVLNPGAFEFENKVWLLLRVAERPVQQNGVVSLPIMNDDGSLNILEFKRNDPNLDLSDARLVKYKNITYLSTISHLRLMCSDDGVLFREPSDRPAVIYGHGALETFGIEDCRVAQIGSTFYLTYTQVSEMGVGIGLMLTEDWRNFERKGMIIPPHNKDCALFEETINDKYFALHRPSGIDLGGNFIWLGSSPDLIHWGDHRCILDTRPGYWDSARVGAGASPIRTNEGWLVLYHGADYHHRYCLGAALLDLEDPSIVLARSEEPLMEPEEEYEMNGFFGSVIFSNGHIVREDEITIYYGASDQVICVVKMSIHQILQSLRS